MALKSFLFFSGAKVGNGNNVLLKIIDGTQTQINEFPWMLSLQVDLINTASYYIFKCVQCFCFHWPVWRVPFLRGIVDIRPVGAHGRTLRGRLSQRTKCLGQDSGQYYENMLYCNMRL